MDDDLAATTLTCPVCRAAQRPGRALPRRDGLGGGQVSIRSRSGQLRGGEPEAHGGPVPGGRVDRQAAAVPLKSVRPRKAINIAVGLVLGLVFGTGLALALESIRRTIRTPRDVVHELHLPVVGMIPRRP